jgi:hypothetical protein
MEVSENHLTNLPDGTVIKDLQKGHQYRKINSDEWVVVGVSFWRTNWEIINDPERYEIVQPALEL